MRLEYFYKTEVKNLVDVNEEYAAKFYSAAFLSNSHTTKKTIIVSTNKLNAIFSEIIANHLLPLRE